MDGRVLPPVIRWAGRGVSSRRERRGQKRRGQLPHRAPGRHRDEGPHLAGLSHDRRPGNGKPAGHSAGHTGREKSLEARRHGGLGSRRRGRGRTFFREHEPACRRLPRHPALQDAGAQGHGQPARAGRGTPCRARGKADPGRGGNHVPHQRACRIPGYGKLVSRHGREGGMAGTLPRAPAPRALPLPDGPHPALVCGKTRLGHCFLSRRSRVDGAGRRMAQGDGRGAHAFGDGAHRQRDDHAGLARGIRALRQEHGLRLPDPRAGKPGRLAALPRQRDQHEQGHLHCHARPAPRHPHTRRHGRHQ